MKALTRTLAFCALALGGSVAIPAAAQDRGAPVDAEFDFEDELVRGDLVRPYGEVMHARRRRPRASLIRVREHFVPELYQSVEKL